MRDRLPLLLGLTLLALAVFLGAVAVGHGIRDRGKGDDSSQVLGYQVTRNFEVRSGRVQAIASVAEASSKLVASGIPLQAQPLQYVSTHLADLRPKLLAQAVRDAQNRGKVDTSTLEKDVTAVVNVTFSLS